MMVQTYEDVVVRQNLRQKIDLAKRLGFHDDVAHWTVKLEATEKSNA
jgi:hypothetical protein